MDINTAGNAQKLAAMKPPNIIRTRGSAGDSRRRGWRPWCRRWTGAPPGVVGVGHHHGAAGVHKTGNIALGIFQVEIPVAVVRHGRRANGVVGKMQLVAAPCHVRQPGYLFLLVGFLVLQVRRYFPAPQAFKFDLIMK